MSDFNELIGGAQSFNWWLVPKIGTLFLLFLYIVFGILVLRQIQLMQKVVSGTSNQPLKILAFFGLGFSVLVFLLALFIL